MQSAVGERIAADECDINARQLDGITCYAALASLEMALLSVAPTPMCGAGDDTMTLNPM